MNNGFSGICRRRCCLSCTLLSPSELVLVSISLSRSLGLSFSLSLFLCLVLPLSLSLALKIVVVQLVVVGSVVLLLVCVVLCCLPSVYIITSLSFLRVYFTVQWRVLYSTNNVPTGTFYLLTSRLLHRAQIDLHRAMSLVLI